MVIFGGDGSGGLDNDVWSLDLATGLWSNITPSGTSPAAREYHTAVYDSLGDRMIVYGGLGASSTIFKDVWSLSMGTPAWTNLNDSYACYRDGHSVVSNGTSMLVFAGDDGGTTERQDTWGMNLSTNAWSPVSPPNSNSCLAQCPYHFISNGTDSCHGEASRLIRYHAAIFDPNYSRMIVTGGWYEVITTNYNNVWSLSGSTWTLLAPDSATQGPPPINGLTMVADLARGRALAFAGDASGDDIPIDLRNDTWQLALTSGTRWAHLSPTGTVPTARRHHSAIFDPIGDRMIVFGGENASGTALGDTWQLSFTDATAPATVTDLDAIQAGSGYVKISWTAPGDDGSGGGAARSYDIRYTTGTLDGTTFCSATRWGSPPTPASPGTVQNVTITGLTNGSWYNFAIKTIDDVGNVAAISNIACAKPGVPASYCEGGPGIMATRDPDQGDALTLAIRAIEPNPSRGELGITFALPVSAPAHLDLLDAAGRRVVTREIGMMGAGIHRLSLTSADGVRPGYYVVRVRQGSAVVARPAIVIR